MRVWRRTTTFIGTLALAGGLVVAAPAASHAADPQVVQILGINDFHGRISANTTEAGAAVLAGAVKQLRTDNPNTVFAAAGDLIGASTFESFIAHDKPTIDALNEAGLEVSAVGNHEFDQGYDDLVGRVMAAYDKDTNPYGGAEWEYLGTNVRKKADGGPALPESWTTTLDGVKVGFVGAVTEHLPELVSPKGIADLQVESIVTATNREADKLKADGADIIVLLVHEGAPTTDCASVTDSTNDFGKIVNGINDNVDAIISGHTHLTYNCQVDVAGWAGRPVTKRPVVSAGQYGYNLDQLLFTVNAGEVTGVESNTLPLVTTVPPVPPGKDTTYVPNYPADAIVTDIVSAAVAESEVLGAQPLGKLAGPFYRAKMSDGTTENRGGESTLGNLVAEAQLEATRAAEFGGAQIAFMNPGGLRQDMVGSNAGGYPATLTYKQAAIVQPFANTLVNMRLTGEQIAQVLEEQWQPAGASRPFLRLGISAGFTYTYDPKADAGSRITGMWLDGKPIKADASYSVTVNSFLAAGGDNFTELANGTAKRDTGQVDLQAMVAYMKDAPGAVAPDFTQRSVGVSFPAGAPASYDRGGKVEFDLSSLAFSNAADLHDTNVTVSVGGVPVGTFPVDNTIGDVINDEAGTASVSFTVPARAPSGAGYAVVTGDKTGTTALVPLTVNAPDTASTTTLKASKDTQYFGTKKPAKLTAQVSVDGGERARGTVVFESGGTALGEQRVNKNGKAKLVLPSRLAVGKYKVKATFLPTAMAEVDLSTSKAVKVKVKKAKSKTTLRVLSSAKKIKRTGNVDLRAKVTLNTGRTAPGKVLLRVNGKKIIKAPLTKGKVKLRVPVKKRGATTIVVEYRPMPKELGNISRSKAKLRLYR